MNFNDITLGQAKELACMLGQAKELACMFANTTTPAAALETLAAHPYTIGEKYAIRTVTMIYVGELVVVYKDELVLKYCSWVADTGRFHDFLKSGTVNEVEPMPGNVIIGRGTIVDCAVWSHKILTEQK